MKALHFGCSYSELWVSPANWETTTAKSALDKNWYVQCVFYDPAQKDKYPKGYPFRKKCNKGKTLSERRSLVRYFLKEIPALFEEQAYNAITGLYMIEAEPEPVPAGELHPDLTISEALALAKSKVPGGDTYKSEVRIAVNRFTVAAAKLHKDHTLIKDFTYGQLNDVFDDMKLTPNYYNKFRSYFIALFKLMKKYGCCQSNIAADLDKQIEISKPREVLELEKVLQVLAHLKKTNYNFYRYSEIFFWSGTRTTELFSVQAKHVRISSQEYDVLVKKGKQYVWETKVILMNSLSFWKELMADVKSGDDFLFSNNLIPGQTPISPKQITKRWRRLIKLKMAFHDGQLCEISKLQNSGVSVYELITADFYSMKHNFLDLIDDRQTSNELVSTDVFDAINRLEVDDNVKALLLSKLSASPEFDVAQRMAAHRSVGMTNKVYKKNKEKREKEELKVLRIVV